MNKYDPLQAFLERTAPDMSTITLSFGRIEEILGSSLPPSARKYRQWWENPGNNTIHPQAQAWLSAGWEADTVDLHAEWVCFRRS